MKQNKQSWRTVLTSITVLHHKPSKDFSILKQTLTSSVLIDIEEGEGEEIATNTTYDLRGGELLLLLVLLLPLKGLYKKHL